MNIIRPIAVLALFLSACERAPVIAGTAAKVEAAKARNDAPAIWRVRDEDSTLYLFGTVHLLPDGLDWQRDDMREAFDAAGTVFFEADTSGAAGVRAEALAAQRGLRRDGLRLTDRLDNYQANLLEAVANNGEIALEALDAMEPWLATEYLTLSAAQSAGLSASLSADEALKSRASRSGKNVLFFETAEDQIEQVAGLPEAVQLDVLTDTMERFDAIPQTLQAIASAWAVGDVDRLETFVTAPTVAAPEAYVEAVMSDRNAAWADRLDAFLDGSGTAFVAVGTAHLLGEESLLTELEGRGHDVQRYLAFMGEDLIKPIDASIPDTPSGDD